jgi:hypothetical protein
MLLNQSAPHAEAPKGSSDFKGGHYYGYRLTNDTPEGKIRGLACEWFPLYEPEKNFTLREARKIQAEGGVAVPSVTTYFSALAKPQLVTWAQENVAKACWDMMNDSNPAGTFDMDTWVEKALATASGASKGAADLGTRIHKAIELAISGDAYSEELAEYVTAVKDERDRLGITDSVQEECVGSLKYGYAGRADDLSAGMTVMDYKSRKSKGKKVPTYETDKVQLAAYGYAKWGNAFFKSGRGIVVAISTTQPGLTTPHVWGGAELVEAFQAFLALTTTWRYINNYDPRSTTNQNAA